MKDKVINKLLKKKREIPTILLLTIPIFLFLLIAFTSLKVSVLNLNEENRIAFMQIMVIFFVIAVCWLIIAIYLLKFTNKFNVIKISKEELCKLYDKYIDEEEINMIYGSSSFFKVDYIIDIFMKKIYGRNKEIKVNTKNTKKIRKVIKIKNQSAILFWLKETMLILWCIVCFNDDIVAIFKEDIYGFIAAIIMFGIPIYIFIKNIYIRYF